MASDSIINNLALALIVHSLTGLFEWRVHIYIVVFGC